MKCMCSFGIGFCKVMLTIRKEMTWGIKLTTYPAKNNEIKFLKKKYKFVLKTIYTASRLVYRLQALGANAWVQSAPYGMCLYAEAFKKILDFQQ